mmetsp:Transcript_10785/g.14924  ORF Transcript_10785/g.14924 Transcript_10785/m.14924 type:complete len:102 (-) Transcript_10785:81-386(-)
MSVNCYAAVFVGRMERKLHKYHLIHIDSNKICKDEKLLIPRYTKNVFLATSFVMQHASTLLRSTCKYCSSCDCKTFHVCVGFNFFMLDMWFGLYRLHIIYI